MNKDEKFLRGFLLFIIPASIFLMAAGLIQDGCNAAYAIELGLLTGIFMALYGKYFT